MQTRWQIFLFGGLSARRGEEAITRFRSRKIAVLLGYLAFYRHRPHPRETLMALLWPDESRPAAQNRLRVALSALRRCLEPPGVPPGSVLIADRLSVGLNPEGVATDVAAFEAALQAAQAAVSPSEQELQWEIAVSLYCGPLLRGYEEDWSLPEQERLADRYFQALASLIERLEQAGEWGRALRLAHQGIVLDPLREDLRLAVMRFHSGAGQPLAGLKHYREWEPYFRREMGTEPSEAARALARELLHRSAGGRPADLSPQLPFAERIASPQASAPPTGTVTFLLAEPAGPPEARKRIEKACRKALARHGGHPVSQPNGILATAFGQASDALSACAGIYRDICDTAGVGPPPVRMALDTGEAEVRQGRYRCEALTRARKLLGAAHEGQTLCSETAEALLRSVSGYRWVYLGRYRMDGAQSAEPIFQIDAEQTPASVFPPLKAEREDRMRLPIPATRFFGREDELIRLIALLEDPQVKCLTLTGTPGVGKTRLALEAARLMQQARTVRFVPLAAVPTAQQIGEAVLNALQVPLSPQEDPIEKAAYILSLRRPAPLLALDNFEHLAEAGAPLVARLLEGAADLTCLVTSRQRLNIEAEQEFPVAPLPLPAEVETLLSLSDNPCMSLFLDRARRVLPDYRMTSRNSAALATICRRLEGIPLALELAASRVRSLTPQQMLEKLDDCLQLLIAGPATAPSRQQTLRATIDWSYGLLQEPDRILLRRLAVFAGGWTLEAAEAVCAGEGIEAAEVMNLLERLIERSLAAARQDEESRYYLLEMIREYALEKLAESGEEALMRAQHRRYCLTLAERAEPMLHGPGQKEWLERLEAEHENLRLALSGAEGEEGLRLAGALGEFWYLRGHWSEGRSWLERMLGQSEEPTTHRAKALTWAGHLAIWQGDHAIARERLTASLAFYRETGDRAGMARALRGLGSVAEHMGFDEQGNCREASLALYEEIGDKSGMAAVLHDLGRTAESLALYRELGDSDGIAWTLLGLGWDESEQGAYASGLPRMEEALALFRELGDRGTMARALLCIGAKSAEYGYPERAQAELESALALYQEVGNRGGMAFTLIELGNVALLQGDYPLAHRLLEEALESGRKWRYQSAIIAALVSLGRAALLCGEARLSLTRLAEALPLTHMSWPPCIALTMEYTAGAFVLLGQPERAARLYGFAEAFREATVFPLPPVERPDYERRVAALRALLDAASLARLWAEGRVMTPEEAAAYALEGAGESSGCLSSSDG